MSSPPVVLHIGLHKTATRYLQRALFHRLDPDNFLVNPEPLHRNLRQAVRHSGERGWARAAAEAAAEARRQAGSRTLLISEPHISGDMYNSHENYAANLELVHDLFPEATILYFVRRQSDWLQSAYRQSLIKGKGIPIERFLNFYEGAFRERIGQRVYGARTVDALGLRFLEIYQAYAERFGPDRVFLFRQEDLKSHSEALHARLARALAMPELPEPPARVSGNRAFSALAIRLFFSGVGGVPTIPPQSAASVPAHGRLHRLAGRWRRLRTVLIKHGFDRLMYRDWDLLARQGMREQLDARYDQEHRALCAIAREILENGPSDRAYDLAWNCDQAPLPVGRTA